PPSLRKFNDQYAKMQRLADDLDKLIGLIRPELSAFGGKADVSERWPDHLDLWVPDLIPERTAVLARIGASDQHAPLPVDADRLRAAPWRWCQRHLVAARAQSQSRLLAR